MKYVEILPTLKRKLRVEGAEKRTAGGKQRNRIASQTEILVKRRKQETNLKGRRENTESLTAGSGAESQTSSRNSGLC